MGSRIAPARLAAIVSSLVLMGGYVYYRSGGQVVPQAANSPAVPATTPPGQVLYGDGHVIYTPTTEPARTMLPGSKVMVLTDNSAPHGGLAHSPPPTTAEARQRVLMSGSKSIFHAPQPESVPTSRPVNP